MKNYYKKSIAIITGLLCSFTSIAQEYTEGVFVLNEGLFGTDTATVSYFDADGVLENDIYGTQNNGDALGNTAQGMGLNGDFIYIVLNGTNAVQVINRNTFEFVTSITDQMSNPRNIAFSDGKAYVTNWGDGGVADDDYVAVIDLASNTVLETVTVAEGPEEILENDGKLFIAHQGGFGYGNTISVLDAATNAVESITVGDVPSALRMDEDFLYVLCSGKPDFSGDETAGSLIKIDLATLDTVSSLEFPDVAHPQFLGLDDAAVYYTLGVNIFKMQLDATTLPAEAFIDTTSENVAVPYGFNVIDGQLYLGDAVDYVGDGKVFVYEEDGTFVSENTVGALPNGFYNAVNEDLGVNDVTNALAISVFPNPATDFFSLNISEAVTITLFDISGRMVKETTYSNQPVSVANLPAGIYVVQLELNGKSSTQKLMIK